MGGQFFRIQDLILHRPGKSQMLPDHRIVEFRPKDARGVQQLQSAGNGDPLLASGDAGPV